MGKEHFGNGYYATVKTSIFPHFDVNVPTPKVIPPIDLQQPVMADGGGLRDSNGKPRFDLIPPEFMEALAAHYAAGATKYADRNWERGMRWGECFRCIMSHAWKWWLGEKYDVDPKMPDGYKAHHMIAVVWNAIACYTYETRKIGVDDRNKQVENET